LSFSRTVKQDRTPGIFTSVDQDFPVARSDRADVAYTAEARRSNR